MITIYIAPQSRINSDGFDVIINEEENGEVVNILYGESFNYGRNASYKKNFATDKAPFVPEIIRNLVTNYSADRIHVLPGHYKFTGTPMGEKEVNDFIDKYIKSETDLMSIVG